MNNRIESFPMINENIVSELNVTFNYLQAKYCYNNLINRLEFIQDEDENNIFILDNNGEWSSNINNLTINGVLEISNYNILFNEHKVANIDTTLGVSITYVSPNSTKTYTKPIGKICYNEEEKETFNFELNFEPGELSSILYIKVSIYVRSIESTDINSIFAKDIGTVLGDIYDCKLIIEGQGSEFPIVIVENDETPLWDMEVNFETLDDLFVSDNVCIKINKKHKDFSKLGIDKISKNNNLVWKEILSSFFINLFIISNEIITLEDVYNDDFLDGTIGAFLKIQLLQFNITITDLNNPIILSNKIRKELDKLL